MKAKFRSGIATYERVDPFVHELQSQVSEVNRSFIDPDREH